MDGGDKTYETLPYPDLFYRFTHPNHVATLATLHGLEPPDITRARVLELGCAGGANIVPMAEQFPNGQFVGIDTSERQIASGKQLAETLGLTNLRLEVQDVLQITPDFGQFDYIIAHGVYSWVPPAVRDKVLEVCSKNVAPSGIAYVSYNTNPGWRLRGMLRDMLLHETRGIADPAQRVAVGRAFLPKFIRAIARKKEPAAQHLRDEIAMLLRKDDASIFHDHMEANNHAVYFYEFVDHARSHGLQFVAEGEPANMLTTDLEPDVRESVAKMDPLDREQYLDYIRCQSFRRSILCHASAIVKRELSVECLRSLYVASALMPQGPRDDVVQATETFQSHRGFRVSTANVLVRRALHEAARRMPERIAFGQLINHAIESVGNLQLNRDAFEMNLARLLAEGFALRGFDLSTQPADFATLPSERPTARRLARLQAAKSDLVVNLRHEKVQLDPLRRRLIQLLDGSRDHVQLAAAFAGAIPPNEAPTWLERALRAFAIEALLVA